MVNGWAMPEDEDEWVDVVGGAAEFLLGEKSYEGAGEWWDRVAPTVARVCPSPSFLLSIRSRR